MRLSVMVALEFESDLRQSPADPLNHQSVEYPGPLATFVAQLTASYFHDSEFAASARRAHHDSLVGCRTKLRNDGSQLDLSV